MTLTRMQTYLLGAAVLLAPTTIFAQTGAGSSMPSQSTPGAGSGSGQTMPGGTRSNGAGSGAMNGQDSSMPGQGSSMTGAGDAKAQAARDKKFLMEAAQGGMAEIKLGQLASQKGSNDQVKMVGQKMVDDHTALNNDMKPIADSMGVTLPTDIKPKDQAEYDKLNGMSGADFDKEYLAYMSKDHHKDVADFKREAATAQDPTLKAAVTKGTKVIVEHTKMIDKTAKANGASAAHGTGTM